MFRRTVSAIVLTLLLTSMLTLALNIDPVKAEPKIWYVDDDGGADFFKIQDAIEAASPGDVIYVYNGTYSENVNVHKSLELVGEDRSITVVDGKRAGGVIRVAADYVNISGFTIQNSGAEGLPWYETGITLDYSHGCTIRDNILQYNELDIWIWNSDECTISGNLLRFSSGGHTLCVWGPNNTITDNVIYQRGVEIVDSGGNTFRNNAMSQFSVSGYSLDNYINDVDTSNIVSGKPIYYWISQHDQQVPLNAGVVVVVNSTDIVAKDLKLVNVGDGIVFAYTNNSVITNITSQRASYGIRMDFSHNNIIDNCSVSDNMLGMMLTGCTNNSITGSTTERNSWAGIYLGESNENHIHNNTMQNNKDTGMSLEGSTNNTISENVIINNGFGGDYFPAGISFSNSPDNIIYHNNLIANKAQVSRYPWEGVASIDIWDDGYPSGGNYWSNYTGVDLFTGSYQNLTGSDGIGDTSYIIDEDNVDDYPLMSPWIAASPGDINRDGKVDIKDVAIAAMAFGSYPGHPRWNPVADENEDGKVDIRDIALVAKNFGKTYS